MEIQLQFIDGTEVERQSFSIPANREKTYIVHVFNGFHDGLLAGLGPALTGASTHARSPPAYAAGRPWHRQDCLENRRPQRDPVSQRTDGRTPSGCRTAD